MLDDFFTRALIAGLGVALVAGPLGCFIVWRRLAYFGETLAHAALLGIALALLFDTNHVVIVFLVSAGISLALISLQRRGTLSSDALLGLLSHSSLALGLVAISFITWTKIDIQSLLFGDILSVNRNDITVIFAGGTGVLAILAWIWRPLFAATVSRELAMAEGMKPDRTNTIFMFLLAMVIAISIKIVGVLLITALLIIPAASARRFAGSPETMAILASVLGMLAVSGGLFGSLQWDTPSGPSIVIAALIVFLITLIRPRTSLSANATD